MAKKEEKKTYGKPIEKLLTNQSVGIKQGVVKEEKKTYGKPIEKLLTNQSVGIKQEVVKEEKKDSKKSA